MWSVRNICHVSLPIRLWFYGVWVSFLPVKQSRSSASSGTGCFFSSSLHIFFIFLDRTGRRPCRDEASTPSLGPSSCRSLPFPGRAIFSAWWTWWMGVSSGLASTLSKLALLPCSTSEGTLGPFRASSNFLTNLKRVLREKNRGKTLLVHDQDTKPWRISNYMVQHKSDQGDILPVGFLNWLFDGPETDVVPLGDLDKVLRTQFISQWRLIMCVLLGHWWKVSY